MIRIHPGSGWKYGSMKYLYIVLVVILCALGITVRLIEAYSGNYVFGFDQGLDFLAARSVAVDHKLTLIGAEAGAGFAGLPGVFHGPGYRYILAILLSVSSGNPYGAIAALAILSLVSLYFMYRLSKDVFGPVAAGAVLVLAAVSPPLTAQARMIWAPNFSGILVLPYLFALWWVRKKTLLSICSTVFFSAALYHFEIPMAVPALLATLLYYGFVLRIRSFRLWAGAVCGTLLGFLPMILFESRHGWGMIRGLMAYGTQVTEHADAAPFQPIIELIGDGNALLATVRESFLFPVPWVSDIFPWVVLGGSLLYAYHEKKRDVRHYLVALLLIVGAQLAVFYPYRGPVYSHYLTLGYFIYPLLTGYVAFRAWQGKVTRWLVSVFGLLFIVGVCMRYPAMITRDYRDYGGTAKIKGKIQAFDVIYKDAAGSSFGLLVFTPPVVPYAYQYIAAWYGQKTYGYTPEFARKPVFYLLIEPDPYKPWSYNGWLETVIKTGTVVRTWKLDSGFIIEKRVEEAP